MRVSAIACGCTAAVAPTMANDALAAATIAGTRDEGRIGRHENGVNGAVEQ